MSFIDEIRRNLPAVEEPLTVEEQMSVEAKKVVTCLKETILKKAQNWKKDQPFSARYCLELYSRYEWLNKKVLIQKRSLLDGHVKKILEEICLSEESIVFHKALKTLLERNGIQISKYYMAHVCHSSDWGDNFSRCGVCRLWEPSFYSIEFGIDPEHPFYKNMEYTTFANGGLVSGYESKYKQGNILIDCNTVCPVIEVSIKM